MTFSLTPVQWVEKGYQNLITDPAPLLSLGGSSKIDSVQNVILIRADLQRGWDGYSLAVNPDVSIFNFYTVLTLIFIPTAWVCGYPVRSRPRRCCREDPQTRPHY